MAKSNQEVPQFLLHHAEDNVGVVVVEEFTAGTELLGVCIADNSERRLHIPQHIPIGHKIALKDLSNGDTVIKYGEDIGKMVADAKVGEHVHTHNLKTKKW